MSTCQTMKWSNISWQSLKGEKASKICKCILLFRDTWHLSFLCYFLSGRKKEISFHVWQLSQGQWSDSFCSRTSHILVSKSKRKKKKIKPQCVFSEIWHCIVWPTSQTFLILVVLKWFTNDSGTSKQIWGKENRANLGIRIGSALEWQHREWLKAFELRSDLKIRASPVQNLLGLGKHEKGSRIRSSLWLLECLNV